jgi:hypothetical protein
MGVLQTIASELKSIPQGIGISLESIQQQLDTEDTSFQRHSSRLNSDRYWIPWTENIGAWVDANGQAATLVVREAAEEADLSGPLMTGLSSVIAGACINLRGNVAIHANAVAIHGRAIGFVGYSGMGKSTLSAYCASRGARFITDDVLIVNAQGLVHSGNARIKLFPHTGQSLGLDANVETDYKIYYHPQQLGATLQQNPIPLSRLYLLAESENDLVYTESLSSAEAVFELLKHSYYASRIIPEQPSLLDAYLQAVQRVPVEKLFYPREFDRLPDVYQFLLEQA